MLFGVVDGSVFYWVFYGIWVVIGDDVYIL